MILMMINMFIKVLFGLKGKENGKNLKIVPEN
jgi:hypothetical protein